MATKDILDRLHDAYDNISAYSVADVKELLKDAANALSEMEVSQNV